MPIIPYEDAKLMTSEQIISLFQWDHGELWVLTQNDHPANFTPRPILEHREKSKLDNRAVKKGDRIAKDHTEHHRVMSSRHGLAGADAVAGAGDEHRGSEPSPRRPVSPITPPAAGRACPKIQSRGFEKSKRVKIPRFNPETA